MSRRCALALAIALGCGRRAADLPRVDTTQFQPAVREAIGKAARAAQAAPADAAAAGDYCIALHAHQLNKEAATCYRAVLQLAPRESRWTYLLSTLDPAVLPEALARNPKNLAAHLRLANSLLDSGRIADAEAAYRSALQLDPNQAVTHYGLGRAASQRNDFAAAIEHLQRAAALAPRNGPIHYALGQAFAKVNDTASSRRHLEEAQRHPQTPPTVPDPLLDAVRQLDAGGFNRVAEGVRLTNEGRLTEAAVQFEQALQQNPRDAAAHQNLIIVYAGLGRIADAESHYRLAIDTNPNAAEAHFNYGVLMAQTGRAPQARWAFEKAIAIEPRNAEAHANLGVLDEDSGNQPSAIAHYRAALASEPAHPAANFRLGRALLAARSAKAALAHLETAAQSTDATLQPQALYGVAVAQKMLGNREKARAAAQAALAKAPPELADAIRRDFPQ